MEENKGRQKRKERKAMELRVDKLPVTFYRISLCAAALVLCVGTLQPTFGTPEGTIILQNKVKGISSATNARSKISFKQQDFKQAN